ncbi:hypothetical protein NQ318_001514 [Aromia moschata]|uniref:Uncharacterized protein n=1 Tax=Aromia moschata TaxID=1265417 RepID=A0AAV8Y9L8_9CUCU|nr:hypothetical protein NQ318_001514 [Aromia moschata]
MLKIWQRRRNTYPIYQWMRLMLRGLVIDDKDNNNTVDDEEDEVSGDNVESVGHKLKNKTGGNYNYHKPEVTTPSGFKGGIHLAKKLNLRFTRDTEK